MASIRSDTVGAAYECPLICFINARSGGRVGAQLALVLNQAIGRVQVFDISEYRPDKVLSRLYESLKAAEATGDVRARTVRQRLRILVCGGDGTIAWVLGVIKKLRLTPEPPVAIMPLGTGNDLSRSFKWGDAFSYDWIKDHTARYDMLNKVAVARVEELDCWRITITMPRKELLREHPHCLSPPAPAAASAAAATPGGFTAAASAGSHRPSGAAALGRNASGANISSSASQQQQQHAGAAVAVRDGSVVYSVTSMAATAGGSAQHLPNIATSSIGSAVTTFTTATNVSAHTNAAVAGSVLPHMASGPVSTSADEDGIGVLGGMFWNYFSVGLDAKAAWGFHSLREARPGCTNSRPANQFWYSFFSCTSGWFCCAQPLNIKVKLEVLAPGPAGSPPQWTAVPLPPNVKALVVLNLQSYAGGRNLWGPQPDSKNRAKPSVNDGLLEVVGLQSGWHTGLVMASKGELVHAKRICQAAGIRLALQAPYVRKDGAPSRCYMQVDGEPWRQEIGNSASDERPVMVEIVHAGTSKVLCNAPPPRYTNMGTLRTFNTSALVVASQEAPTPQAAAAAGGAGAGAPFASNPASLHAVPEAQGGGGGGGAPCRTALQVDGAASGGGPLGLSGAPSPGQAAQRGPSARRPSAASGSAAGGGGGSSAAGDTASLAAVSGHGGRPHAKSGSVAGGGAGEGPDGQQQQQATQPSSPINSPTPRTLSVDGCESSYGGRSAVQDV